MCIPPRPQALRSTWVGPSRMFTGMLGRQGRGELGILSGSQLEHHLAADTLVTSLLLKIR